MCISHWWETWVWYTETNENYQSQWYATKRLIILSAVISKLYSDEGWLENDIDESLVKVWNRFVEHWMATYDSEEERYRMNI